MPELDVLDLWSSEAPLVVHPGREEDIATNRAAPCPERLRVAGTPRVDVVVEQVPVLRDKAARGGLCVVGPEHGAHIRLVHEDVDHPTEGVRMHEHVRIE